MPQAHGGALQVGNPGNRGGTGRPPSEFRRLARELLHDRNLLPRLGDIAEGKLGEIITTPDGRIFCETPVREQRGAIDALLKVGVPSLKEVSTEEVRARVKETVRIIQEKLPPELATELLDALEPVWE